MGAGQPRKWWGLLRPATGHREDPRGQRQQSGDGGEVELVTKVELPGEYCAGLAHDMAVRCLPPVHISTSPPAAAAPLSRLAPAPL